MEVNQDNDGPPAAAGGLWPGGYVSPPVPYDLKMYRAVRDNSPDLLQRLIDDKRAGIVSGVYDERDEYDDGEYDDDYYAEFKIDVKPKWTYLHFAAVNGHTECVRILLNEGTNEIDARADDGSTPLMAACANLPDTVECIKLLCEHNQDLNLTNEQDFTALQIAIVRKPDLEVVMLLVGKGADMGKADGGWRQELMMLLFSNHGERYLNYPSNEVEEDECEVPDQIGRICCAYLWTEEAEIAEIAMYLANQGCVKEALNGVLNSSKWVIQSPRLLEQVVECFLEKGAVLNGHSINYEHERLNYRPLALSLFAQKSIIYLEGIPMSLGHEPSFIEVRNAITVLLLQGLTSGILPLTSVTQIHDILQRNLTPNLPNNFLPLKTLYAMTRSVPSLSQLARTKIRRKMAECGKFSRENIEKLAELPQVMIDFVQLDDLGWGTKVEEIMKEMEKET